MRFFLIPTSEDLSLNMFIYRAWLYDCGAVYLIKSRSIAVTSEFVNCFVNYFTVNCGFLYSHSILLPSKIRKNYENQVYACG